MKIGLFGGTFDPIHLGHSDLIQQVQDKLHLDKVICIPAYIPPHKKNKRMASFEQRYAMVQLAVQSLKMIEVSPIESERSRPSYTYDTLCAFRSKYPKDTLVYIIGTDAFNEIETWYRWKDLFALADFAVIDRVGNRLNISNALEHFLSCGDLEHVIHLPLHTLPISSTMIRNCLQEGKGVSAYLAPSVAAYIEEHQLYRW